MSDDITLSFGFDRKLFPRAMMGWWRSAMPPAKFSTRITMWMVIWFALLALTIAIGNMGLNPAYVLAGMAGAGVLVAVFVVLQTVRMRRFARVIERHWTGAGEITAEIGPAGARFHTARSRIELDWPGVDAVAAVRGATVFRSGVTMIAIPDGALPADLSPAAFRARIETWRAA